MNKQVLVAENLCKSFVQGDRKVDVLTGAELTLSEGEIVGLVGQSGSGKSTLLQILGLLDRADSGDVLIQGRPLLRSTDTVRTNMRREKIGFVYQAHHLLPEFSALENVMMPLLIGKMTPSKAEQRAKVLIERVGMMHRLDHRPGQLSGGEQQRIAIVRALANHPKLILADEPTGNLDPETASSVFKTLLDLVRDEQVAILIATHNQEMVGMMDRVLSLKEGKVVELKG